MRPLTIIGSAVTAGLLTMVAAIIAGVVAVDQVSVTTGVITRSFLVIAALAITAFVWWSRMKPGDPPEALLLGLVGGWVLNVSSWAGASFAGQLFTSLTLGAVLIDLTLWAAVSYGLVFALSRTAVPNPR
ncbi:hypothetical protein [Aeromicrobium sp.]|uniref:hypothetical protein n=1 Tax=Aeromicrobium sp. TaxID=1871063 RepID=UPI003D6ABCD8